MNKFKYFKNFIFLTYMERNTYIFHLLNLFTVSNNYVNFFPIAKPNSWLSSRIFFQICPNERRPLHCRGKGRWECLDYNENMILKVSVQDCSLHTSYITVLRNIGTFRPKFTSFLNVKAVFHVARLLLVKSCFAKSLIASTSMSGTAKSEFTDSVTPEESSLDVKVLSGKGKLLY